MIYEHEWVIVLVFALLGGVVNAIMSGEYFLTPKVATRADGRKFWDPGFVGIFFVSVAAGLVAWGLSTDASFADTNPDVKSVILALLAGSGGGKVLAELINKQYL